MYCYIVREYVALQKFKDRLGFRETHHGIIVHVFFINWVYQQSINSDHLVLLVHLICED